MIFMPRRGKRDQNRSGAEACLSMIGLFLAIALISGLAGLIYGLTNSSSTAVVAGGAVFGVSLLLGIVFVLFIVFCFKTTEAKPIHRKGRGRMTHINNSHDTTGVSTVHKSEPPSGSYPPILYPTLPLGFTDNDRYGSAKQTLAPPMQTTTFDSLNQSYSSTDGYHLRPSTANHY